MKDEEKNKIVWRKIGDDTYRIQGNFLGPQGGRTIVTYVQKGDRHCEIEIKHTDKRGLPNSPVTLSSENLSIITDVAFGELTLLERIVSDSKDLPPKHLERTRELISRAKEGYVPQRGYGHVTPTNNPSQGYVDHNA